MLPNWLHVEVAVEDRPLSLEAGGMLEHRRLLDLRQGVLWREWRQQDPSGRITRLSYLQLASLADRHVLLQSVAVTAENYAGRISLITGLAPSDVTRTDMALIVAEPTAMLMRVSGTKVAIASASELQGPAGSRTASHEGGPQGGEERWSWEASLGETARLGQPDHSFISPAVRWSLEAEFSPHEHGRATPPLLSFIAQGHLSTVASLAMSAPLPSQEPCGVHRMKAFGTCSARSRQSNSCHMLDS